MFTLEDPASRESCVRFLSSGGALCGCIGAIWIKQELYRAAHGIPRVMQGPDKAR